MPESPNRQRLAELMEERRKDLRLRWQDVAEASGLSLKTLHSVRSSDKRVAELTKTGIEDGLRWEHGSIDLILSGGDPVPLPVAAEVVVSLSPDAGDIDIMQVIPVPGDVRDAARPYAEKFHRRYVEAVARTGSTDPAGDEVFPAGSWDAQSWDRLRRHMDPLRRLGLIAVANVPEDSLPAHRHGSAAGLTEQDAALDRRDRAGGAA